MSVKVVFKALSGLCRNLKSHNFAVQQAALSRNRILIEMDGYLSASH
jgi:hypothetical protein